jgi:hypothetical protein
MQFNLEMMNRLMFPARITDIVASCAILYSYFVDNALPILLGYCTHTHTVNPAVSTF